MLFADYGERVGGQSWTVPGTKVVKPIPVSRPEKPVPKPSNQVTDTAYCYEYSIINKASATIRPSHQKDGCQSQVLCLCVSQPSAVPTAADWQSVADKRIELLSSVCKNSSLRNLTHVSISKFVLDRIFVCDKHKILFCQTPKVGNTQWKKVLIVLNGEYGPDDGNSSTCLL